MNKGAGGFERFPNASGSKAPIPRRQQQAFTIGRRGLRWCIYLDGCFIIDSGHRRKNVDCQADDALRFSSVHPASYRGRRYMLQSRLIEI